MSRFVQLHVLTSYPPSNLNRDDTGRPKTAEMGNVNRLRISSQSQKRAWRTSGIFESALHGHIGSRTKALGSELMKKFVDAGVKEKAAREWAEAMIGVFAQVDKKKASKKSEGKAEAVDTTVTTGQLVHYGPEEVDALMELADACIERNAAPDAEELKLLRKPRKAVDIALFGRMLADKPAFNVEAAVQVSHAITVHRSTVEDDYFSAVDDLNKGDEDRGAGHIGERGFGAGLFYLYVCVDRELLRSNLGDDTDLSGRAVQALLEAITKVSPTGMQNSHASRAYASYVLAEKGNQQPRSLSQAFLRPVNPGQSGSMLDKAVAELLKRRDNFAKIYGPCSDADYAINVEAGEGTLSELIQFAQE